MKKIIFLMMIVMFVVPFVNADVIPENSHSLSKCVKIVNLNEFSDIYLIGHITGPCVDGLEPYIIEENKCLRKGYKFNKLTIIAAKKTYIDSIGMKNINPFSKVLTKDIRFNEDSNCYYDASNDRSPCLDRIEDWYEEKLSDENFYISEIKISPYGGYVDEDNPLVKTEIEYSIAGFSDDKLILYKSKETSEYNDGTSKKVETYEKPYIPNLILTIEDKEIPEPIPEPAIEPIPTPEPKGFWSKIACFFKGIFGRSC